MYKFRIEKFDTYQMMWVAMKVTPIYGDGAKLSVERETNERFCRYDFDGALTFVNDDYATFIDSGLSAEYRLVLLLVNGAEKTKIIESYFSLSDMELDCDNKIAKLKLKGKDQYEDFLAKYDSEYDLVQLAPPRKNVDLFKRAFLQIYVQGDTKLTHILGNFEYEASAVNGAETKTKEELETLGFTQLQANNVVVIDGDFYPEFNGVYSSYGYADGKIWRSDKKYYFKPGGVETILHKADGSAPISGSRVFYVSPKGITLVVQTGQEKEYVGSVTHEDRDIFARIIHDNVTKGVKFSSEDIWQRNLNYRCYDKLNSAQRKFFSSKVIISTELTSDPNKWMSDGKGHYFVRPTSTDPTRRIIAIGWNQWIPMSIWFDNGIDVANQLNYLNVRWTLQDAYSIEDSINVLLGKIDKSIRVKSTFLENRAEGGYANPILGRQLWLYITPITNIKRTYYNHASQRGKITLKQILDMLKECFNCYWFLQWTGESWVLRIEHIKWFKNGGDYYTTKTYKNLTEESVALSSKQWMKDQDKATFDLGEIRSRVEFKWADKSSEIFNGYPMVGTERFVKDKSIEKVDVANFVADIDIIESSPDSLSDDLYVVIGSDGNNNSVVMMNEIGYYDFTGTSFKLSDQHPRYLPQNSALSFYFLEQMLLNYNISANEWERVEMEMEDGSLAIHGRSTKDVVSQRFTYPYVIDKPDLCVERFDTGSLTSAGEGSSFRKITTDLSTQTSEFEVMNEYNY